MQVNIWRRKFCSNKKNYGYVLMSKIFTALIYAPYYPSEVGVKEVWNNSLKPHLKYLLENNVMQVWGAGLWNEVHDDVWCYSYFLLSEYKDLKTRIKIKIVPLNISRITYDFILLQWKFHGQRSLTGCNPWVPKESDMSNWACVHVHTHTMGNFKSKN